jgi:hypothetical protein
MLYQTNITGFVDHSVVVDGLPSVVRYSKILRFTSYRLIVRLRTMTFQLKVDTCIALVAFRVVNVNTTMVRSVTTKERDHRGLKFVFSEPSQHGVGKNIRCQMVASDLMLSRQYLVRETRSHPFFWKVR